MTHPSAKAYKIINSVMETGSAKDGKDDSWQHKPRHFHITKAIRHATTALMVDLGVIQPDGENHLELALCRLAMALSQD